MNKGDVFIDDNGTVSYLWNESTKRNSTMVTLLEVINPITEAGVASGALILLIIFGVIISILPIILFFKVWGMCNNVKTIKSLLAQILQEMD